MAGLRAATGLDRQLHAQQLFYLLRNSPLAAAISALRAQGSATVVPARPDEHDQVCAIIERFEGPASADLARAWLSEQPEHLSVVRTGDGVAGFAYHVLCPSGSALEDRDPVVRAVLDHVARDGPLRPGERVDIVRFCAGAREHQRDPYALLAGTVSSVIEWLTRPLAWSFIVVVDTEYWHAFFDYMAFAPLVDVDVGGLRHVAYGIDWRRLPVDAWLDLMHERGRSGATGPPPAALLRPPPLDRPASPRRSRPPCRPCTGPTNSPPTRSSAPRWPPDRPARAPTNSGPPSRTPSPTSATNPRATNSGPSCTAPTYAPPPPRKPPPKSSTCH